MNPYYTSFFRRGDKVYIREITADGARVNYHVQYKPKLYMVTESPNCEYKTLAGDRLQEVEFQSIKSAKGYADAYQGKMYGYNRWEYACVNDIYPHQIEYNFNDLRILYLDIETNSDTHFSSVQNPDQPITLIQLLLKDTFYIFGTQFYESYDDNVKYIRCKDEVDLLKKFVTLFRKIDPDIITGWNSKGYDVPMLYARMNLIGLEDWFKKLSPFNMVEEKMALNLYKKEELNVEIKGIQHLDMKDLVIKFDNMKYENVKLDTVAKGILKRGKVAYDGSLGDLYYTDFNKFVEYGKVDVELVRDIEAVKNLIQMVVDVTYMDKVNFIDAYSQVRMWDNQIMCTLKHEYSVQVPYRIAKEDDDIVEVDEDDDEKFEGAFVYEPVSGRYVWVMSDDVQSMHPSIIMSFNVSPETYVGNSGKTVDFFLKDHSEYTDYLRKNNYTSMANGAMFDASKEGFLPKLVKRVFDMRVDAKDKAKYHSKLMDDTSLMQSDRDAHKQQYTIYNTRQNALKVKINSMFGFLGNKFSRFYQLDMAEGITLTSQVMLKSGADMVSTIISNATGVDKDKVLIYGDTDSLYYSMESVVKKYVPKETSVEDTIEFMDRYHKAKIKPFLEQAMTKIQESMNVRTKSIRFVRDVIADVGIFVAKKKYIISVWDSEGKRYKSPEMKAMGIESVKTSTPQYCRDKIKEAIKIILYNEEDDFHNFIEKTKQEFLTKPVEDISFPRRITDIDKYVTSKVVEDHFEQTSSTETSYAKGSPLAAKASIYYNKLIDEHKLGNRREKIVNGDNIKYTYLTQPNPIKNNAIAYLDNLPKEFGLHKYIDYETQWEKSFYKPVSTIASFNQWTMEPTNALF